MKLNRLFFVCLLLAVSAGSLLLDVQVVQGQGFFNGSRWSRTATDGSGLARGDATTLTWGIIADGTPITRAGSISAEGNDPSDLINMLDTEFGAGAGGADLTQRPWYSLFEDSYDRWGEVSGLEFNYEPNDTGADIRSFPPGVLGSVADMRIGGHSIDGASGVLAYNYFPQVGDMVIDTDDGNFFDGPNNNFRAFRNVIMHEVGHGLGIRHLESNTDQFLMEPFASSNPSFDGPQFADILAAHRLYGDSNEEGNGNDTSTNATSLGNVDTDKVLIGEDAFDAVIGENDIDFVSIDGSNDTDFFSFEITEQTWVNIELTPMGPTYNSRAQGASTYESFDASAQNNLELTLFDTDGTTILALADINGLGGIEFIKQNLSAGTYFIRVRGQNQDEAQFYSLDIASVPEPAMIVALSLLCCGGFFYVRSRKNLAKASTTA